MPCNSDHMVAQQHEVELSQVACLLDELIGEPLDPVHWRGYHPRVYNQGYDKTKADKMVAELCAALQGRDVSKLSLEMQTWWRDHQKVDAARIQAERDRANLEIIRRKALSKLSKIEKLALGLTEKS